METMMNSSSSTQNSFSKEIAGFTLIELLVSVAIISIIASVVMATLNDARVRAEYTAAQQELVQLSKAIVYAQIGSGNRVQLITGSGCSACQCAAATDLRNIDASSACYTQWESSLEDILAAGDGVADGLEEALRDPWGSPYLLDENEGEMPGNFCRADTIHTAGEDGIRNTSDDYSITLPFATSQCN